MEMGKVVVKIAFYTCFLLFLLAMKVTGRYLCHNASELISDGINDHAEEEESSFLHLKGMDSSEEYCKQMYGFLPCSESLPGHFFLIVVYEYLLFKGESWVISGGERIFEILGPGIFGASAFPAIGPLPESLILLASGLLSSNEMAQEYVATGVGLLAGSTIFLLTLLWGTCLIFGAQNFSSDSNSKTSDIEISGENQHKKLLSPLTGSGATIDQETRFTSRIMLLSLIPFIVILIPKVFGASSSSGEYNIVILVTLFISVVSLLGYFIYQMFDHRIQERRLEYVEVEHQLLVLDIIHHVQGHISERLLTRDGAPNETAIKLLFKKIDVNGDNHLTFPELKALFQEMKLSRLAWDKKKVMEKIMEGLDSNDDKQINYEEFYDTFTKWLDEIKCAIDEPYHSASTRKNFEKAVKLLLQERRKEEEMMQNLTSAIIKHVESSTLANFCTEEGAPDQVAIRKLFEKIDVDHDDFISQSELKTFIKDVNLGEIKLNEDEAVVKIMNDFDTSRDKVIDVEEFIKGLTKWLNPSNNQAAPNSLEQADDDRQRTIKELVDRSVSAKAKAIMLLMLGIAMLAVLAEPLIQSVQKISTSAKIPPFYISFVLVPLATNARTAISAIRAARRKKPKTTSLTFSEIYNGVFMNNILGFVVLLSIIYFRGLTWHFSAEVMIVVIVCAIMGLIASFGSNFPFWTMFIAYLLYPLSLILVYVLDDSFWLP